MKVCFVLHARGYQHTIACGKAREKFGNVYTKTESACMIQKRGAKKKLKQIFCTQRSI